MFALSWLAITLAYADCAQPVSAGALSQQLDAAEAAWAELNPDGFRDALQQATLQLPCIDSTIDPSLAARWHRMVALEAYAAGDEDLTSRAFAASRAADPTYVLPEALVPGGHELRKLFESDLGAGKAPVPAPATGEVRVDGRVTATYAPKRPALVQVIPAPGQIATTDYVMPGDVWPTYALVESAKPPVAGIPKDPVGTPPGTKKSHTAVKVAFGGVAGLAAIGAGIVYARADQAAGQFDAGSSEWTRTDLEDQRRKTNSLAGTAVGLAGIAGLGVVFAVAIK